MESKWGLHGLPNLGDRALAQVPRMEAAEVMGCGICQKRRSACLPHTGSSCSCSSNQPHIPAGPSIPRSVPGQPPHLQVKRARHGCKGSSPCSLVRCSPLRRRLPPHSPPWGSFSRPVHLTCVLSCHEHDLLLASSSLFSHPSPHTGPVCFSTQLQARLSIGVGLASHRICGS